MGNIYDVASAIQQPNVVGNFNQGVQTVQLRQQNQNTLNKQNLAAQDQQNIRSLAPQVIAGDPNAYSQVAAIDPAQATQLQGAGDDQVRRFSGAINMLNQATKTNNPAAIDAAWQQARPYLSQIAGKPAPDHWDPSFQPGLDQAMAHISQLPPPETAVMTPGSEMTVKGTGQVLHSTPFADKIINNAPIGPNGEKGVISVNPGARGQGTIVGLGGAPQPAANSGAFYGAVNDLAGKYGATITSGVRSPEHNAEVGGVPNSQHLTGTAADVVIPPDQKQAFIDDAKAKGLQPIDEGDHVHLQNPNGGAGVSGVRLAVGTPAAKVNSWQQRIDAAKSLGASGTEVKGMVLGSSGMQNAQASELSPGALENATWNFLQTGVLPPVGRGGQGQAQRTAIMNHAADIATASGVSPSELSTRAGQQKALQGSMNAYQKRADAMAGQEQSFLHNLSYAQQISDSIDRTRFPTVNHWLMTGEAAAGDPEVVKLKAALTPVAADYAKIMSGATGAGGTPVSTMQEAMDMIRTNLSKEQFNSVSDVLRNDVHNQRLGSLDQLNAIRDNMSRFGNGSLGGSKPALTPQQEMLPPGQQPGSSMAPAGNAKPSSPTSDAEYNALPSGAAFIDPDDGKTYRKP